MTATGAPDRHPRAIGLWRPAAIGVSHSGA